MTRHPPHGDQAMQMTEKQIEELRDRLAKMPKFDRGIIWRYRDWGGTERLETFGETANALKYVLDNTDAIVSVLSAALAVEAGADNSDTHRAANALLNTLWQLCFQGARTHEENWAEMDRRFPQARWLHDALKSSALTPASSAVEGEAVELTYTNWRGETSVRSILPKRVWFGATEWHPDPQWLLTAFDIDKQAERDFALKDFGYAPTPAGEWREALQKIADMRWAEDADLDDICTIADRALASPAPHQEGRADG